MLKKENRLKETFEFQALRRSGKTVFTPLFNFSFRLPLTGGSGTKMVPRFGFITSTNLDKRATTRNLVKRRVREAVRLYLKGHILPPRFSGLTGVFIIRKAAVTKGYEEIDSKVNQVLSQLFEL
jgi:ribonuclease P protein component